MHKISKPWLIVMTIISFILCVFGMFYIPILSSCGVQFPERNLIWGLSIIPTVIVAAIPFLYCLFALLRRRKPKRIEIKND